MLPNLLSLIVPPGGASTEAPPWLIVTAVGAVILVSLLVARRAARVQADLDSVARTLASPPRGMLEGPVPRDREDLSPDKTTAVLFVEGFDAAGMWSLLETTRILPGGFPQLVLMTAREFDMTTRDRAEEARQLKATLEISLKRYFPVLPLLELRGDTCAVVGPDLVTGTVAACMNVARAYPKALFFWSRPLIDSPRWHYKLIDNRLAERVAQTLFRHGWVTIDLTLPIRVPHTRLRRA